VLGVFSQVKAVGRQLRLLTALNLELAKLEGKKKATALGLAGGLALVAAALVLYAIGFAFAAAAAGLAEALPLWLSLLIVAGAIFLVAGILGFLAMRFARKASPPQPSQAIKEAEWTLRTLRGNG
jgi:Putative Actinobacterial Holin-X, holin superfamily III